MTVHSAIVATMALLFQTHAAFFVVGSIIALALLGVTVRLTGATGRDVGIALGSGWVAGVVNLATDSLGHHLGWWKYPRVHAPFGPLITYVLLGPAMAFIVLIAMRLRNRYGNWAIAALIAAFGLYGAVRDHSFVAATGWIQWAPLSRHTTAEFQIRPGAAMAVADAVFEFSLPVAVATVCFVTVRGLSSHASPPSRKSGRSGAARLIAPRSRGSAQ